MTHTYIVLTSSAQTPGRFGRYRNVALIKRTPEYAAADLVPVKIDSRAKGVEEIVTHYGKRNVGKTLRCDYKQTLFNAQAEADRLNGLLPVEA